MAQTSMRELKAFYCYGREDQALRERLDLSLAHLKRRYRFSTWFDRLINPGDNWEQAIEENLNSADLVFLLISPDFMSSNYCYNKEMQQALERHARGETRIIPILLRPTYWEDAPFSSIQMLPTNGIPLTRWPDLDEAFQDIVVGINRTLQALLTVLETDVVPEANTWPEANTVPKTKERVVEKLRQQEVEHSPKNPQQSVEKKKADVDVSGHIQGAIVNIGGQTDVQGNITISLQNMQQSFGKPPEDKHKAD